MQSQSPTGNQTVHMSMGSPAYPSLYQSALASLHRFLATCYLCVAPRSQSRSLSPRPPPDQRTVVHFRAQPSLLAPDQNRSIPTPVSLPSFPLSSFIITTTLSKYPSLIHPDPASSNLLFPRPRTAKKTEYFHYQDPHFHLRTQFVDIVSVDSLGFDYISLY